MGKLRRILIIDDNEVTNLYRRRIVNNLYPEIDVHVAENGKAGLDFFIETDDKPRLIFLDLHMPVMNGFEFLQALNDYLKDDEKAQIRVVISSSADGDAEKQRSKNLYPNISFCPKPVSKDTILQIISELEKN